MSFSRPMGHKETEFKKNQEEKEDAGYFSGGASGGTSTAVYSHPIWRPVTRSPRSPGVHISPELKRRNSAGGLCPESMPWRRQHRGAGEIYGAAEPERNGNRSPERQAESARGGSGAESMHPLGQWRRRREQNEDDVPDDEGRRADDQGRRDEDIRRRDDEDARRRDDEGAYDGRRDDGNGETQGCQRRPDTPRPKHGAPPAAPWEKPPWIACELAQPLARSPPPLVTPPSYLKPKRLDFSNVKEKKFKKKKTKRLQALLKAFKEWKNQKTPNWIGCTCSIHMCVNKLPPSDPWFSPASVCDDEISQKMAAMTLD